MNAFELKDLYPGLRASFKVQISPEMLEHFIQLSGDNSPLHTDQQFAQAKGHQEIPVHGMLTAAFYSRLVGLHLPGVNGYSQEYKIAFTAPVYVGDVLIISGEITMINEVCRQIAIKAQITKSNGEQVSRANIKAGLF